MVGHQCKRKMINCYCESLYMLIVWLVGWILMNGSEVHHIIDGSGLLCKDLTEWPWNLCLTPSVLWTIYVKWNIVVWCSKFTSLQNLIVSVYLRGKMLICIMFLEENVISFPDGTFWQMCYIVCLMMHHIFQSLLNLEHSYYSQLFVLWTNCCVYRMVNCLNIK